MLGKIPFPQAMLVQGHATAATNALHNDGGLMSTLEFFELPVPPRSSPRTRRVPQTGVLIVFGVFAVS
jgi:hypothetical protein